MSDTSNQASDELDLVELFGMIWAHKTLVLITTLISLSFGLNYYVTAPTKYRSIAIFEIDYGNQQGISLGGELGSIAAIAGLSSSNSSSELLLERIRGREFILDASKNLSLVADPLFNSYVRSKSTAVDPQWKSKIKKIIGWAPRQTEREAIIEKNILSNFQQLVEVDITKAGAMTIAVTHTNAKTAAEYANSLMDQIKKLIEFENKLETEKRLIYLSETLADALQELEKSQSSYKEYVLINSAAAQENFMSRSVKLDSLRIERRESQEILSILEVLEDIIKANNLDEKTYETLRIKYPIIDDVSFRRILGMSETISAWSWPNLKTTQTVTETLSDRIRRLDVEILNFEDNTRMYASSAENLAKLQRESKIAEATYAVLIEQVKTQSLAAGLSSTKFKVYEYARASLSPSHPKRTTIFGISTLLGLAAGLVLSFINAQRSGVFYSTSSIRAIVQPALFLRSKPFRRISRWSISKISSHLNKQRIPEADEIEVNLSNKKLIYVMNCKGRNSASGVARLLATKSSLSGRNIFLWDKTGQSEKETESESLEEVLGLSIIRLKNNLSILARKKKDPFFTSLNFKSTIEKLMTKYDQVYVCSGDEEATLGLLAMSELYPSVVLLARLRKTRKIDIKKINSIYPVETLLYD